MTSVIEDQTDGIPPEFFYPSATADTIKAIDGMYPHFADADGNIGLRVQALVIEVAGRTIVVDPCVGNGRTRTSPFWNDQHWPFMERFTAAGFDTSQVDLVVHTHLHTDHVGWGTYLDRNKWVPTFPGARYVYVREELEWLRAADDADAKAIYADSIEPIIDAGLADMVEPNADLGHGLRLEPTVGHTPGHVSLWLESAGETALITGDVIHHPFQCAEPTHSFVSDADPDVATATRTALLRQAADRGVLTLGTHFPTLPAGRVLPEGDHWRFAPEHPSGQ